jgi:hypothetical protein
MQCPKLDTVNKGPIWQDLHIGVSQISEVRPMLEGMGPYQMVLSSEGTTANSMHYVLESRNENLQLSLPPNIDVCTQNNIVTVIAILWPERQPSIYLKDLVKENGFPDTVTWTPFPKSRVAFWFKKGIAAEIFIGTEDSISFGRVFRLIYFPYQSTRGYEQRWPYNRTWPIKHEDDGEGTPTEQNPFNFKELELTLTAEPSESQTLTPQPTLSKTPFPILIPSETRRP